MAASVADAPAVPGVAAPAQTGKKRAIYYGYYLVGVALVAQFVSAGTQTYVAGVFLDPMTTELGWTRAEFTSGQTISRFVMAFAGFFIGSHVDKGRARGLMVVGTTILGFGLFATSAVQEEWQWWALRGIVFTAGASMLSNLVVNVTLSKWWVEKRGFVVGISSMGVSLAGVILPPLMTPFVDEYGWRAGWQLLGVIAWVLIYPASMLMRSTPEAHGLNPDGKTDEDMASARGAAVRADFDNSLNRSQALRTSALYLIVLAFGLSGIGLGTMLLHTIPFMTDAGFDRGTASRLFVLLSIPAAFSKPVWGYFLTRVREKLLAAISFAIAAIGMPIVLLGGHTGALPILAVGLVLVGTGLGGQIPIQETIWGTYFGRRYLGQVRSVALPFSLLLGAGGPQVVAFAFDVFGNYDIAFTGVALGWTMAAFLVLLVRRPEARGQRPSSGGPPSGGGGAPPAPSGPRAPTLEVVSGGAGWGSAMGAVNENGADEGATSAGYWRVPASANGAPRTQVEANGHTTAPGGANGNGAHANGANGHVPGSSGYGLGSGVAPVVDPRRERDYMR